MKRIGLALLVSVVIAISLASCSRSFVVTDANAKKEGFRYKIEYRLYEIKPWVAQEKFLTPETFRRNSNGVISIPYAYTFYANHCKIKGGYLQILDRHIKANASDGSARLDPYDDSAVYITSVGEIINKTEKFRFGRWETTKTETWISDEAIINTEETKYYIGFYSVENL